MSRLLHNYSQIGILLKEWSFYANLVPYPVKLAKNGDLTPGEVTTNELIEQKNDMK